MKRAAFCLAAALICLLLCACTGIDGKAPDKKEVLRRVYAVCTEEYELVGVEQTGERPEWFVYTFVTPRGLTFTADSYLQQVYIDASATNFYTPTVSVNYAEAVRALYSENITDLLAGVKPSGSEAALLSYDGIGALARCVAQANDVYAQELAWNDEDFLRDHPYGTLAVYWYPDEASRDSREGGVRLCGLPIDGLQTEQALYDAIAAAYAQAYVDGRMPDPGDIPDDLLSRTHVSRLTTITLNGREMTYDTAENPYASYGLTTDDYRFSWYNRDRGSYMLISDIGFVSDSQSYPLVILEYVAALGGEYHVSGKGFSSDWTIGGVTWTMEAQYDDGVQGLTVTRDGVPLAVDYITYDDDSTVNAAYCVGIPVEQFAQMFDLSYSIDEENQCLAFFSA